MNILTGSELIGNYPVGDMLTLLALTVVVMSGIFFGMAKLVSYFD